MVAWCRWRFSLLWDGSGKDMLPFIRGLVDKGAKVEEKYQEPELYLANQTLISIYFEIAGSEGVQYSEIIAWQKLSGIKLPSWAVKFLKLIDSVNNEKHNLMLQEQMGKK